MNLSFDKNLFLLMNENHSLFIDELMIVINNMLLWVPIYLVALIAFFKYLKDLKTIYIVGNFILLLLSLTIIIASTELFKPLFDLIFNRPKPCNDSDISSMVHLVGGRCEETGLFGFFAERAFISFGISTFLLLLFDNFHRWIKYYLIAWAILISYSRIYLGVHFPLNIFVSDLSGILVGISTFLIYRYMRYSLLVI